jgi:hypothetical protein
MNWDAATVNFAFGYCGFALGIAFSILAHRIVTGHWDCWR